MKAEELRRLQAPIKEQYQQNPESAKLTLKATGTLNSEKLACKLDTGKALVEAGLHEAAGGDGVAVCAGDMLLEALVACAGVTLRAVSTALEIPVAGGTVTAEGEIDFRGTLGVSKEVPVGLTDIRLRFDLETSATGEQLALLKKLTERYCVIYQTLAMPPALDLEIVTH